MSKMSLTDEDRVRAASRAEKVGDGAVAEELGVRPGTVAHWRRTKLPKTSKADVVSDRSSSYDVVVSTAEPVDGDTDVVTMPPKMVAGKDLANFLESELWTLGHTVENIFPFSSHLREQGIESVVYVKAHFERPFTQLAAPGSEEINLTVHQRGENDFLITDDGETFRWLDMMVSDEFERRFQQERVNEVCEDNGINFNEYDDRQLEMLCDDLSNLPHVIDSMAKVMANIAEYEQKVP